MRILKNEIIRYSLIQIKGKIALIHTFQWFSFLPRLSLFLLLLSFSSNPIVGQSLKMMSFNIRYDNPNDGVNNWHNRKKAILDLVLETESQIIGIQEGLFNQVEYLDSALKQFSYIGEGRDGGEKGEFSAILYNKRRLKILKSNTFWLSPNSKPLIKGWDAALPRICTYAQFKDKETGDSLWVFNTHFDHIGEKARLNSAKLIIQKIKDLCQKKEKVILMGDLNCLGQSLAIETINSFMKDAYRNPKWSNTASLGTFNGFDSSEIPWKRIDYLFSRNTEIVNFSHLLKRMENGNYISDHFPVFAEIK